MKSSTKKSESNFLSKELAEFDVDHKQLQETIYLLLLTDLRKRFIQVLPMLVIAFQSTSLTNFIRFARISSPPLLTRQYQWPRAQIFINFKTALESAVWALMKSTKRSCSPAYPIPVLLLCIIIDSICPAITVAINYSPLATGIGPDTLKSATVKQLLKNLVLIKITWRTTIRCLSFLSHLKFLNKLLLINKFCISTITFPLFLSLSLSQYSISLDSNSTETVLLKVTESLNKSN